MKRLYSYVLRYDDGAAPNPFWGTCTLAICKPVIRRNAKVGDWVIGTGSKRSKCNDRMVRDLSRHLVYAMKVSDVISIHDYDEWCHANLPEKIPLEQPDDWRRKVGDCLYYRNANGEIGMREYGTHRADKHRDWDLGGERVLLGDEFYYFGEAAIEIPPHLTAIIKQNQNHLRIVDEGLIIAFEEWISGYTHNHLYGEPQLKHRFEKKSPYYRKRKTSLGSCSSEGFC